jgi:hypothetical protein
VNFWSPYNPDPNFVGIYEYFKPGCTIFTSPYADDTGTRAYNGSPLDPDAPADQTQFWGKTNREAASGRMGIFVAWYFARTPTMIPPATFRESVTGVYDGQLSAENFFHAADGESGWGTFYPLPNAGSGFMSVPNHGAWAVANGVREGGGGIGGFPSGGFDWNEWYVKALGLLIPGDDGTGGQWVNGDDVPLTTAVWSCPPNIRRTRISTTVDGIVVYG